MRKLILLAFMTLLAVSFATPVFAQVDPMCSAKITDQLGVFADTTPIHQAITQLDSHGADARVFTVDTSTPLNDWQSTMVDNCPGWSNSAGMMADQFILVAISSGRDVAIYYGDKWAPALDSTWESIIDNQLVPRLSDGEFVEGFTDTLLTIDAQIAPASNSQTAPQSNVPVPAASTQSDNASSAWWLCLPVLMIFGLLAAVLLLISVTRAISNSRKADEDRREAQDHAKGLLRQYVDGILKLDNGYKDLEIEAALLSKRISSKEAGLLTEMVQDVRVALGQAKVQSEGSSAPVGDPNDNHLSLDEYEAISRFYATCLHALQSAQSAFDLAAFQLKRLQGLLESIHQDLVVTGQELVNGRQLITSVEAEGFKVADLQAKLGKAESELVTAREAWSQDRKPVTMIGSTIELAQKLLAEAMDSAKSLKTRRQQLLQLLTELREHIVESEAQLHEGQQTFARIRDEYPAEVLEPVAGNPEEAAKRLSLARELVDDIEFALTMEIQQWDEAATMLHEAEGWLDEVDSLMRSIATLVMNYEQAMNVAQSEITAAYDDIATARTFLNQATYAKAMRDAQFTALTEADVILQRARAELDKSKPNYFQVAKLAQNANKAADTILAAAQSAQATEDRLRKRAASTIRTAKTKLATTEEYFEDHANAIQVGSKRHLTAARQLLAKAIEATDLNTQIQHAEQCIEQAEQAYNSARDDFRAAEALRNPPVEYNSSYPTNSSDPFGTWGSPATSSTTTRQQPRPAPSRGSSTNSSSSWGSFGGSGGSYGGSGGGGSYGGRSSGGSFTSSSSSSSSRSSSSRSSSISSSRRSGGGSKKW